MKVELFLELAGEAAKRDADNIRLHAVGAVGVRTDGAIVRSRNGHAKFKMPEAHAEARLCDKLNYGTEYVFVARVRKSGEFGLARPCADCTTKLIQKGVKRVYYTTNEKNVYGMLVLNRK